MPRKTLFNLRFAVRPPDGRQGTCNNAGLIVLIFICIGVLRSRGHYIKTVFRQLSGEANFGLKQRVAHHSVLETVLFFSSVQTLATYLSNEILDLYSISIDILYHKFKLTTRYNFLKIILQICSFHYSPWLFFFHL